MSKILGFLIAADQELKHISWDSTDWKEFRAETNLDEKGQLGSYLLQLAGGDFSVFEGIQNIIQSYQREYFEVSAIVHCVETIKDIISFALRNPETEEIENRYQFMAEKNEKIEDCLSAGYKTLEKSNVILPRELCKELCQSMLNLWASAYDEDLNVQGKSIKKYFDVMSRVPQRSTIGIDARISVNKILLAGGYHAVVDDTMIPNFTFVDKHLFRGAQASYKGFFFLSQIGINNVVDLRGEDSTNEHEIVNINYKKLSIISSDDISFDQIDKFVRYVDYFNDKRQKTLVYCHDGIGPTGVMIACWRIRHGMGAIEALCYENFMPYENGQNLIEIVMGYAEHVKTHDYARSMNRSRSGNPSGNGSGRLPGHLPENNLGHGPESNFGQGHEISSRGSSGRHSGHGRVHASNLRHRPGQSSNDWSGRFPEYETGGFSSHRAERNLRYGTGESPRSGSGKHSAHGNSTGYRYTPDNNLRHGGERYSDIGPERQHGYGDGMASGHGLGNSSSGTSDGDPGYKPGRRSMNESESAPGNGSRSDNGSRISQQHEWGESYRGRSGKSIRFAWGKNSRSRSGKLPRFEWGKTPWSRSGKIPRFDWGKISRGISGKSAWHDWRKNTRGGSRYSPRYGSGSFFTTESGNSSSSRSEISGRRGSFSRSGNSSRRGSGISTGPRSPPGHGSGPYSVPLSPSFSGSESSSGFGNAEPVSRLSWGNRFNYTGGSNRSDNFDGYSTQRSRSSSRHVKREKRRRWH